MKIKSLLVWATAFVVLLLALFIFSNQTQSASLPTRPYVLCPHCPKLIGKGVLSPTEYDIVNKHWFSVLRVISPKIKRDDIVIHSIFSPDEVAAGHRIGVWQIRDGVIEFWITGDDGYPTTEEPEIHYVVYDNK